MKILNDFFHFLFLFFDLDNFSLSLSLNVLNFFKNSDGKLILLFIVLVVLVLLGCTTPMWMPLMLFLLTFQSTLNLLKPINLIFQIKNIQMQIFILIL